ncbi:ABC transporter permease [Streptomyces sp. NRRL F-5126]|uniref:ABC transporter permease n=1 Tax=Streptomyces sp. NRRL F-5126 TaxID=1463857 RepID=UPI0004C960F9|nr:ABC transporter permease [Streptomyces sp. NRRL F-5126]
MFRTSLRNVLAHKARLLMTVLAVLLGVAFVSGTLVFTDTLGKAYADQSAKDYKGVAVAVSTEDQHRLTAHDLDTIRDAPGVATVTGRVSGFAGVAGPDGKLIGTGWSNKGANFAPDSHGRDPSYAFRHGNGPRDARHIALDARSAAAGGYHVGDRVRVATDGPVRTYTLSGVFTTHDGAVQAGGSLVLFDTAQAQHLYLPGGRAGRFMDATVTASPGASDTAVLAAVKRLLPHGATADTGSALAGQDARTAAQSLSSLNKILLAFAGIALFVGVFLISNTFTMLVAQRSRELALLRAIGASRRQVRRSVIVEAALVGLAASVAGFVLGLGLAVGLRSVMGSFGARVPAGPLVVGGDAVAAALGVGVLVTLLAAWLPSRRAAKIPPVAAMSSAHAPAGTRSLVVRNCIGAALAAVGAAGIAGGASVGGDSGRMLIAGGAFLLLIGVIVLIPLLSRPAVALVRPLLRAVFGTPGNLASRNAVRNPRRTGATASALAIGLTLVTGLTVLGVTLGSAVDRMTTDSVRGDYMVSMASGSTLAPSVASELAKVPGVTAVSPQQAVDLRVGGHYHSASAVTPGAVERVLTMDTVDGSLRTLAKGEVAVARKTAASNGWHVGDRLRVTYDDDRKGTLTIGATYEDNQFLSPLVVSTAVVAPHEKEPYIPQVWVKTAGGASAAHEKALVHALGDSPAFTFQDRQDIRQSYGGFVNTALALLYALLAMALIIAVLGVVNTLAMSVFERRREIGMLRAIGLDRARVKRMIRVEAVVISMFGAVLGVVLGTFLAWAIGRTIRGELPGYELVLPWGRIALFLVLSALVGVLASLWPARSAARLDVLGAVKTE